ncbi:hypothetical protein ACIP2X_36940 [Streptomyces sp. NPDC089424]|uniref:hypothetical protein n=1 Tax=Streptomyces sp. NPDC089424 TaxID=3365917 RepID=UPI0037FBB233
MIEAVVEVVLTVICCLAVAVLVVTFVMGWELNRLAAGGAGGAVLVFLGYGGWELMRSSETTRRPGRLAGAAVVTFVAAVVFVVYGLSCGCS